jgi:hypothetical protein
VAHRPPATNRGAACLTGPVYTECLTLSDDGAVNLMQEMLE